MKKNRIIERVVALMLTLTFTISPLFILHAEDYPAGYLGSGYREYISDKMQKGYYVEVFSDMEMRQKERVAKRNEIEKLVNTSYQATPQANNGIQAAEFQKKYNADNLKVEIANQRREREGFASVNLASGFNYIPNSDGQIDYFKDGLLIRSENERAVDEFGNVSLKNTYNIKYNDRRLMISYEADLTDNLGNISHQRWYGAAYTGDSVFYGNDDTVANKNVSEYYLEETDSAGNVKITHWNALSYEGKFARAFHQRIEDSIYGVTEFTRTNINYSSPKHVTSYHEEGVGTDGLAYTLDRTNVSYNDVDQLLSYHEEMFVTQLDHTITKITTDAQFKYVSAPHQFGRDVDPDPNRLAESIITVKTENADGLTRTETTTIKYSYDAGFKLIGASGHSEFNGQEADWYEYTDREGHVLTRHVDDEGNVTYSYVDPDTLLTIIVSSDQVTSTLKEGNKYVGSSEIQYEILYGTPMTKQIDSKTSYYGHSISESELIKVENSTLIFENGLVNNLQRRLSSQEHTETTYPLTDPDNTHMQTRDINLTYLYDAKGNLSDVEGSGTGSGWEYSATRGWYGQYTSKITEKYEVVLGKPIRTDYYEDKDYLY